MAGCFVCQCVASTFSMALPFGFQAWSQFGIGRDLMCRTLAEQTFWMKVCSSILGIIHWSLNIRRYIYYIYIYNLSQYEIIIEISGLAAWTCLLNTSTPTRRACGNRSKRWVGWLKSCSELMQQPTVRWKNSKRVAEGSACSQCGPQWFGSLDTRDSRRCCLHGEMDIFGFPGGFGWGPVLDWFCLLRPLWPRLLRWEWGIGAWDLVTSAGRIWQVYHILQFVIVRCKRHGCLRID